MTTEGTIPIEYVLEAARRIKGFYQTLAMSDRSLESGDKGTVQRKLAHLETE